MPDLENSRNRLKNMTIDLTLMTPGMTRELNRIAESYRLKYTKFIDRLSDIYGKSEFWWDTPLASRNIYLCSCFKDICILRLALNLLERYRPDVLIVPDIVIKTAIMDSLHTSNTKVIVKAVKKSSIKEGLKSNCLLLGAVQVFRLKKKLRFIKNYKREFMDWNFQGKEAVIVSTPRIPYEVKKGRLYDRYFSGLKENSCENLLFFAHCSFSNQSEGARLLDMLLHRDDTVCFERYIRKEDFHEVYKYLYWMAKINVKKAFFDRMNVTAIVKAAVKNGCAFENTAVGILMGNVLCRLTGEHGLKVRKLVEWYEGQASSNAMIRRFRKRYPQIPTAAYVLSPCGENNLGLYPSVKQRKKNIVPEYFAVQGPPWAASVRQFDRHVKCIPAPSFRFQNVFYAETVFEEGEKRKGILLVLPYQCDSARRMLEEVSAAVRNTGPQHIYVKNHPVRAGMKIKDYGIKEGAFANCRVTYVTSNLSEAAAGREMAVLSMTTSSLEVLMTGIRVISYIPPGELTYLCVPEKLASDINIAFNARDIEDYIRKKKGLPEKTAERVRNECFIEVNRETVKNFLDLIPVGEGQHENNRSNTGSL